MELNDNLKAHLDLQSRMSARAAAFPGSESSPYVKDVKAELRRTCDWLVDQQIDRGPWPENKVNLRFYSDAYAIRALLAAWRLLEDERYVDAASRWLRYLVKIQRSDGGWWVGYSWGDHDFNAPDADQSVVYVADAGEVSLALVCACHALRSSKKTSALADEVEASLARFRMFCEHFRLRTGVMGLGYTYRDFYDPGKRHLPYMQAHHHPWGFSTAVTGVNTYAGLYTLTGSREDWEKAMQSLDWLLEHVVPVGGDLESQSVISNDSADVKVLHRVMDWAFDCCPAPRDESTHAEATPEPRFAASERQKLYALWKYVMHRVVDVQSALGEWTVMQGGLPVVRYNGALRHRLIYGYNLTTYLGALGAREGEDEPLRDARDRQLWLAADERILHEHYGVCMVGAHVMPTGLWGMTLAELLQPGITLPNGIRRITGQDR
jgi:hypothetical protein